MTAAAETPPISLPGYRLTMRLGSGGYGEVWLAHAPGGLNKAVKFIYGDYRGKRAALELKSLQRIKEVRHPFLLSLERIEVVEDRLVIVTELAEASLKDRFDQCHEQGLPGIPRDELLGYLRDAADALDFLCDRHSLQHLDVKPENLLLIGEHIKVADFGLVKDVDQSQASLVGGLTPLYSAPEVFQGTPTRYSDQYSLAVLYAEMLTGVAPFNGSTPAELTLQHLHDEPELQQVPLADRYVLSRALAKDPKQRYATCREMVRALAGDQSFHSNAGAPDESVRTGGDADRKTKTQPETAGEPAPDWNVDGSDANSLAPEARKAPVRRGAITEEFDESLCLGHRVVSRSMLVEIEPPRNCDVEKRPPLPMECGDVQPRPLLVIGIGGTAASVLQHFRAVLTRKYGDRDALPAVQLLLIDTDPRTIHAAMEGPGDAELRTDETLALPLRRPQEYRDRSSDLTRWLSRRWLYNIPRSLRTEGLRPLGRLAFADHARRIVQRIRIAMAAAMAPEALSVSSATTGLEFRQNAVDVRVVASVAGGTGGGMSLDVGYAVRAAVDKLPGVDATSVGLMLYSTGSSPRHHDLACVNAFSWLTEFNHFNRPQGRFPGCACSGLNDQQANVKTFDNAYLIDLGRSLEEREFAAATQAVAHYLALDALTPARRFFDECRKPGNDAAEEYAALRTFSLHRVPAASEEALALAAHEIRRGVVLQWAGDEGAFSDGDNRVQATDSQPIDAGRATNQLVRGVAQLVGRMQLQVEGLATNARELLEGQFNGSVECVAERLWERLSAQGKSLTLPDIARAVEAICAGPGNRTGHSGLYIQDRPLESVFRAMLMKINNDLSQWILAKLDERGERLAGAKRSAKWLSDHFASVERDADRLAAGFARQIGELCDLGSTGSGSAARHARKPDSALALQCLRLRMDQAAVQAAALLARRLKLELSNVQGALAEFGRHLRNIAEGLPPSVAASPETVRQAMDLLAPHKDELLVAADEKIHAYLEEQGGLFQTVMGNTRLRSQMLEELQRQSLVLARRASEKTNAIDTLLAADEQGKPLEDLTALATKAMPRFLQKEDAWRGWR